MAVHASDDFGMTTLTGRIALWLFVIYLGLALGAGLYEGRIVVPDWVSTGPGGVAHWNAAAARHDDTGVRFWAFVTTVPLTVLTLVNLFFARRAGATVRRWWLAAGFLSLAERVITFAYFIPTMIRLMDSSDTPAAAATAIQWSRLNYGRHVMVLAALLTALKTFASMYQAHTPPPR